MCAAAGFLKLVQIELPETDCHWKGLNLKIVKLITQGKKIQDV